MLRKLHQIMLRVRQAWQDQWAECYVCRRRCCGHNAVAVAGPAVDEDAAGLLAVICLDCFRGHQELYHHLVGTPICDHGWWARPRRLANALRH